MKINFEYDTKYGKFSDSLDLPDDQLYTDVEIEAMKEARRDAWVSYIDNAQLETTPIDEQPTEESPLEGQ
jgi:hypothetical protein